MADKSAIEWTDATWNPVVGCSIVSPGCTNCYAMKMAARIQKMNRTGGSNSNYVNHYDGTTQPSKAGAVWTGKVALAPDKLFLKPLGWKSPRRIFVNSMGDLFHESIPDEWIDRVFAVMALCPQHTFQVLTKRAERMRKYLATSFDDGAAFDRVVMQMMALVDAGYPAVCDTCVRHGIPWTKPTSAHDWWPLRNVWLGVSCERQQEADERIPLLLQTPAAVRFISAEPLLGPIDLTSINHRGVVGGHSALHDRGLGSLDWVIVGGESGPRARLMEIEWARSLRDQCASSDVPFFFKQWGAWEPGDGDCVGQQYYKVGKKKAGRLLDGREHNGFPQSAALQSPPVVTEPSNVEGVVR